jgi:hypothetical protein
MVMDVFSRYCNLTCCGHEVVAGFSDAVKGETEVYLDCKLLDELPTDYVLDFHIHKGNLYIIYNRAIRRVANIDGGNTTPDEGYTLEMQDYYSYEPPKMLSGYDGTLWVHIGGRLFRADDSGAAWTQVAEFPTGEEAEVTSGGLLKFSKNLLRDDNTDGYRTYDPATGAVAVINN